MRRGAATILMIGLVVAGAEAGADVLDASPTGFTLENSRDVDVDATTIWSALIDEVDRWWPKDHTWWGVESRLTIDPRAGGCFCEAAGERYARHMAIVFVEPPRLLRMVGGLGPLQGMGVDGVMEWRITSVEGGTRITLHYRAGGYTPDNLGEFAPVVDQVQAVQLGGLADFVAGKQSVPRDFEPAPN